MTPAQIVVKWAADIAHPLSAELTALVTDADGNPIPGVQVELALAPETGSADALSKPTDSGGKAVFNVAWREGGDRRLTLRAGTKTVAAMPPASSGLQPPGAPP
jgi:hypothetical protein